MTASTSVPPTPAAVTESATALEEQPVGIIALGHSGLTGENSDPARPGQPATDNSWATGTSPAVDSIYARLVAQHPDTEGRVSNKAEGGADAGALARQAKSALTEVSNPQLVIIQTIDHDVRCDGTDDVHVPEFGSAIDAVLKVLTTASPGTKVLMLTQPGRPASELESMAELIASNPKARAVYSGGPPCGMLDENGDQQPENIANLTTIIEAYEAEQERVCAQYPQCSTAGEQLASFRRVPSMVSNDFNHLNTEGQAALASAVWPVVEQLLDDQ